MNEIRILQLLFYAFLVKINCDNKQNDNYIPHFRKQAEEIEEYYPVTSENEDPHVKYVSLMINNPKEVFNDEFETAEVEYVNHANKRLQETVTPAMPKTSSRYTTLKLTPPSLASIEINDDKIYDNRTLFASSIEMNSMRTPYEYYNETLSIDETTETIIENINDGVTRPLATERHNASRRSKPDSRRCIVCNNMATEDCNNPRSKVMQTVLCERGDDVCYSMHTPFGIVDRGCFNPEHNLTTFVCSCNLCNYVPFSEMPYKFNSKLQWIDNVIDISRTRRLRKSLYTGMSCLKCEFNRTFPDQVSENVGCLQGNVTQLPVEECHENEVCGVKALRAHGYIWRGCVKAPLYNYWWTLCGDDLCNTDHIMSLYDFV